MPFCTNCGEKVEEGTKFCTKCGAKIENSESGGFNAQNQRFNNQSQAYNRVYSDDVFRKFFSEIWKMIKGMMTAPKTTICTVSKEISQKTTYIFGAILAVIYAFLNMWILDSVVEKFESSINSASLNQIPFVGSINIDISDMISFSSIFFFFLFLYIIVGIIVFGTTLILGRGIFKIKYDKTITILNMYILASIPAVAGVFGAAIFSYVSIEISLLFILAGGLFAVLSFYSGIKEEFKVLDDKMIYGMILIAVVLCIGIYIYTRAFGFSFINRNNTNEILNNILR